MTTTARPRQQPLVKLGARTLLALTCWNCGLLRPGHEYGRSPRVPGGPLYVDRRCTICRWRHAAGSPGR